MPLRLAVGVGLEVEHVGLEQDLLEQQVDAGPLLGRDAGGQHVAAELLEDDAVLQELLHRLLHVGRGEVDLVDGHDHRARRRSSAWLMASMVCGMTWSSAATTQHDDVGHLGAAGTHGGERLVARGVEEGDATAARQLDVVGADVLGDAAGLAGDDVRLADVVEERRLAVVDVAHDRDDRGARLQRLRRILFDFLPEIGGVFVLTQRLEAELRRDQLDLVEVQPLVDRHHQAQFLEGELDDLAGRDLHQVGELGDGDELVDPDAGLLQLPLLRRPARHHVAIRRFIRTRTTRLPADPSCP